MSFTGKALVPTAMIAIQPQSRQILGVNQQSYQALKAAMGMNLRHQLLIAVCDDVRIQNQLATQLEVDLSAASRMNGRLSSGDLAQSAGLERLLFDPEAGHLPQQVAYWMRRTMLSANTLPALQVLGIEQMTHQPAITQNYFLRSLEKIELLLPCLDASLLLWMPWPWLRTIRQSAPTFWNWRSGIFEFVSDPSPIPMDREYLRLETAAFEEDIAQMSAAETRFQNGYHLAGLYGESEEGESDGEDFSRNTISRNTTSCNTTSSSERFQDLEAAAHLPAEPSPAELLPSRPSPNKLSQPDTSQPDRLPTQVAAAHETSVSDIPTQPLGAHRSHSADEAFALGLSYRNRLESGEHSLTLVEAAISAYEEGLHGLSNSHPNGASALNDLGTLYWLKAQQVSDHQQSIDCMSHSLQLYRDAVERLAQQPQGATDITGQLYSNMGALYSMLALYEEPVAYLNQAAVTYLKAMSLVSEETDSKEYATLQNSLGAVYWKLSHYDQPTVYLQQATTAYKAALSGYRPAQQPLEYAAVQNNLGITYWSLAKHERASFFLKHAIAAYRQALTYRTPAVEPTACATTYNNLALAYWDLSRADQVEPAHQARHQKNAIVAFEAALRVGQAASVLSQTGGAAIYHCLGDVHAQMVATASSSEAIAKSLQKSLHSYLQAINGLPEDDPAFQNRLSAIVANLRAHYEHLGSSSQQSALNRVPSSLMAQVIALLPSPSQSAQQR
ncbi:MAG: tetratricopeptide repeat protein [Phormidesmis sp.]